MEAYDADKLAGSLARALTPQNMLQRTAAGTPATEADFSRIHEEACTLLLLRPQLAYWFAYRATNLARAHLRQTVGTLEGLIVSLVDALTPSVPVASSAPLTAAARHLETAERVASLGKGSTKAVEHSLSRAFREIDDFSQQLVPNVAPRVGDRTTDTSFAVGDEAQADARTRMDSLDKEYRRLMDLLTSLRVSVHLLSVESLRQKASTSFMQRAGEAVTAAANYYDTTPPEEATKVSSAVLANLQAFSTGTKLLDSAQSALVPKVLSKQLQLEDATGRPGGSDYQLVPAGTPDPLTVSMAPAATLPVGAQLVYSHDGAADTTVPVPGAGLFSLLGSSDLSSVTVPNPSYLYIERNGALTAILLTPGASTIAQVVADINAVIPGLASQFGNTGRLLLSSTTAFSVDTVYSADVAPAVTSDAGSFPSATNWQATVLDVIVQDSGGVHHQTHTFSTPFIPASIAAVVSELNVPTFTDAAGVPVLAVSASGNSLMLTAAQSGDVTITVSMYSTVVTGGHISWTTATAYGRSSQGASAHTVLGLEVLEAAQSTDPHDIVDAVNDTDSPVTASLDSTGTLSVQVDSPVLGSNIEVKTSMGLTELGATAALTRASTSSVEVHGLAADGREEGTHDPEILGVQVGDRVRVASGSEEFDVSVVSLSGDRIVVDSGVPGDIGESNVRIDDGAMQGFENLARSLAQVRVDQLPLRSPKALHDFHLRWAQRLTGRKLSPGDVKKALEIYVGLLNVLTATLEDQAAVDERLAILNMEWSAVHPTVEEGLEENAAPSWAPGTVEAGVSLLQAFEERGYDRAVELLNEGRLRDFVELTPLQASRSGRVESALFGTVDAMRGQVP